MWFEPVNVAQVSRPVTYGLASHSFGVVCMHNVA